MPQLNVRFSDEQLASIDAAIRRVHVIEDPVGQRGDYVRAAALIAADIETHERQLGRIVHRYEEIVRRARPRLAPAEWRLILDACNGLWLADAWSVAGIPLEVADACRLNDLATKWLLGEDDEEAITRARAAEMVGQAPSPQDAAQLAAVRERGKALVARLAACSYAELAAIAHVVETWWGREPRNVAGPVPGEEGWVE
jgi:hypothetical protein